MKNNIINKTIRTIAFLLCAVTVFSIASLVYERKTYKGEWNYMGKMKEFYEMKENSLDYIVVGSSHAYCSVSPLEIWKETGISGFVLATQQQPLRASYHYIKEAFKTQSPKYVVLEGYMAVGSDKYEEGVLYDAIDPLKASVNKIQMINALVEGDDRPNYYFNILKYHSRWKDVTLAEAKLAFDNESDIYKGYVALEREFTAENLVPDYDSVEESINYINIEALNDILKLTRENNAELIIMIAPFDAANPKIVAPIKALKNWVDENEVYSIDYSLLLDEIGIDPNADYYDSTHLDVSGSAKLSLHLAQIFKKKGLTANSNIDTAEWEADYTLFKKYFPQ